MTKQLTIQAQGEAWTAFDDVPKFEGNFWYRFETDEDTPISDVFKRVKMRSTPHIGFLQNLVVALIIGAGTDHELEMRLTEPTA